MAERETLVGTLRDSGVARAIRWAAISATDRVMADYSEAAGHDAAWVGVTRFTLFRDRLDRVFATGTYAVPPGSNSEVSLDVLHAELTSRDIATMPVIEPGTVTRADLDGSPGWAFDSWRWLLASSRFGRIDRLPWPQKSQTKQRVAQQVDPDPAQPSLFEDEDLGHVSPAQLAPDVDLSTLVVAHSQDVQRGGRELVIGRPRMNAGGGDAWYWYEDLLSIPPDGGGRRADGGTAPTPTPQVPDAPVRLRRASHEADAPAEGSA
jgi:hypothetical protein